MKKRLLIFAMIVTSGLLAGSLKEFSTESRVTVKTRQFNGVGYDNGYSTGAAFLAPVWRHEFLPFIDLRAHVFDDGRFAFNGGLGLRVPVDSWIFGGNLFYDYRNGDKFNPQQIGGGLEALGQHFDIRLNGYGPIANTDYFALTPVVIQGHTASYKEVAQAALPTIAGEIGMPFNDRCSDAFWYGAIGPYYLFGREVHDFNLGGSWGGKARVAATFGKIFQVECDVTYDKIFHTTVQGVIAFHLPLGPRNLSYKNSKDVLCNAITQPVVRNEIIPIQDPERVVPFINQQTEQPAYFIVVNQFKAGSKGTWESPYSSLLDAEKNSKDGDIILVAPGEYSEGITLKENQLLTSTAMPIFSSQNHAGPWHGEPPLLSRGVVLGNGSRVIGFQLNTGDEHAFSIHGKSAQIINCHIQTTTERCSIDVVDAPRLDIAYCTFAPDTEICFRTKVNSTLNLYENTFEGSSHERVFVHALEQSKIMVQAVRNNFIDSSLAVAIDSNASGQMIIQDNSWNNADLLITVDGDFAFGLYNNTIGQLYANIESTQLAQFVMQDNSLSGPAKFELYGYGKFNASLTENSGAKFIMNYADAIEGVLEAQDNPSSSLELNARAFTNLKLNFGDDAWPDGQSVVTIGKAKAESMN